MLSAYELSNNKYPALLTKAKEVADTMSVAWVGVGIDSYEHPTLGLIKADHRPM